MIEVVLWEPRGGRMRREAGEEGGTFGRGHILFTPPATRLKHVWTQFRMFCLFLQFQYILFKVSYSTQRWLYMNCFDMEFYHSQRGREPSLRARLVFLISLTVKEQS